VCACRRWLLVLTSYLSFMLPSATLTVGSVPYLP
jgi:hypothetical protein